MGEFWRNPKNLSLNMIRKNMNFECYFCIYLIVYPTYAIIIHAINVTSNCAYNNINYKYSIFWWNKIKDNLYSKSELFLIKWSKSLYFPWNLNKTYFIIYYRCCSLTSCIFHSHPSIQFFRKSIFSFFVIVIFRKLEIAMLSY